MSTISKAIAESHAQIRSLQADIDALQRAKTIVDGRPPAPSSSSRRPARRRRKMSATARNAVSKRMKAYWAAKRKAKK